MFDFVNLSNKRTNHWRTLRGICSADFRRYFQNFPLKANQQFVEILTSTYIFQSHSIYNIYIQQSRAVNHDTLRLTYKLTDM